MNALQNRIQEYESMLVEYDQLRIEFGKQSSRYSAIRLFSIIGLIPAVYIASKYEVLAVIAAFAFIVPIFIWAVIKQQKADQEVKRAEHMLSIINNELSVINTRKNSYSNGSKLDIEHHFYSSDLDIVGPYSLFRLLNRAKTYHGVRFLSSWLLNLSSIEEITERQEAVKELSNNSSWIRGLQLELFDLEDVEHHDVSQVIHQTIDVDLGFANAQLLRIYVKALPFIWPILIGAMFLGFAIAQKIAIILLIFNILLSMKNSSIITNVQGKLSLVAGQIIAFVGAFSHITKKEWTSNYIKHQLNALKTDGKKHTLDSLVKLSKIIERLDFRLNIFAAFILNGLLLWDIKIMQELTMWKENNEHQLDDLFSLLGKIEAISSLAIFAYHHQDIYRFPEIKENYFGIEAKELRHPLMDINTSISNDFSMQDPQRLGIITGSNMSGKSTFLRTLGANMVLAYAGTITLGKSFTISHVQIISYMRIKDALEESVSTFKAELNRIALILEMMKSDKKIFVLIDEMLRGTNSKDKLNGSIAFTKQIIESKTPCLVATHDVKLSDLEQEYPEEVGNYYFDIDFIEDDLYFDYKIKDGVCTSFNASFLLKQLGIDAVESE